MATRNATPNSLADLLESSCNTIESLRDDLAKLGMLFHAIAHAPSDRTAKLADLGHFLAEDWSNGADVSAEEFRARVAEHSA